MVGNKHSKILALGLALVMMLSTLTACGGSSSYKGGYATGDVAMDSMASMNGFASSSSGMNSAFAPTTESIMIPGEGVIIEHNTEEYSDITENRFLAVKTSPLSPFAADVDTASYSNFRRFVNNGELPPEDAIRIEEMINYFHYDYDTPTNDDPFACTTEVIPCPWNEDTLLLSIGLATDEVDTSEIPPQNLVFLIDVSGSMESSNKLGLVKRSFQLLCEQLKPTDTISIVTYASSDEIIVKGVTGDEADLIMQAIEELSAGGSTNASDGIETAYAIAEEYFIEGGNNRVIIATDGDFNVGTTSEGELERLISNKKKSGVYLSVMGFGMGNYKDNKMETLADKGNGNYYYIDTIMEARKALVEDIGGTLVTVAKDAKLQVEFNPATIKGYRLIGYENRLLAAEDFADDTVDGGEIGAGHRVTALYEIVPVDSEFNIPESELKYQDNPNGDTEVNTSTDFCTVSVRCKEPDGDTSKLWEFPVAGVVSRQAMSNNIRLSSAVAQVGMLLRESEYSGTATYKSVLEQLEPLGDDDALIDEFTYLVRQLSRMD